MSIHVAAACQPRDVAVGEEVLAVDIGFGGIVVQINTRNRGHGAVDVALRRQPSDVAGSRVTLSGYPGLGRHVGNRFGSDMIVGAFANAVRHVDTQRLALIIDTSHDLFARTYRVDLRVLGRKGHARPVISACDGSLALGAAEVLETRTAGNRFTSPVPVAVDDLIVAHKDALRVQRRIGHLGVRHAGRADRWRQHIAIDDELEYPLIPKRPDIKEFDTADLECELAIDDVDEPMNLRYLSASSILRHQDAHFDLDLIVDGAVLGLEISRKPKRLWHLAKDVARQRR